MKGIYLTQGGKQEIEAKIAELEKLSNPSIQGNDSYIIKCEAKIEVCKEILSSAIILPVEESWENVDFIHDYSQPQLRNFYPNGVIIKSK